MTHIGAGFITYQEGGGGHLYFVIVMAVASYSFINVSKGGMNVDQFRRQGKAGGPDKAGQRVGLL